MPSIASQRMKLDIIDNQPVSVVHEVTNGHKTQVPELQLPVSEGCNAPISPPCRPVTPDMSSTGKLSQRHPIDELSCEPPEVSDNDRTSQIHKDSSRNSPTGNSEFGPFVSGFGHVDLRPRSSSFNSSISKGQRTSAPATVRVDPLRRLSESPTMIKTTSAENVVAHYPSYTHGQLRHSHTVPGIPPMALSIDSGYHTPPQNRQPAQSAPNTSPPWPPNAHMQWQLPGHAQTHFAPSVQDLKTMCGSSSLSALTIDTGGGHYQPERAMPMHPPPYLSIQPPAAYNANYNHQRAHDGFGSLQQTGSQTPEEGVCGYQRERKLRLQNVLLEQERLVDELKMEEQMLLQELAKEEEKNREIDNNAMEREIESLNRENQQLAARIRRLAHEASSAGSPVGGRDFAQSQLPITCIAHVGVPSPPIPAPRHHSPSRHNNAYSGASPPPAISERPRNSTMVPPPPPPPPPFRMAEDSPQWACSQCTYLNHHLISTCELCETPRPRAGMI
ncbi:TGF-beta-activated kinase 1 and MAP3K7-binding protein 3-like isoform X2 [Watersipora subatra]|uniref:TGF-beta-activated kinase 1 and MAP3K7-binding protein 3-like isoform X2 n=1 Tax=Watersipora subatra TaxID=2589382 RepID=UPI00355B33B3